MTQPTDRPGIDQLRNLADRAERHGGLTPEEAARLRDGIEQLYGWLTTARAVAHSNRRHVRAIVPDLEAATQRAERAEATLAAVRDELDQAQAWANPAEVRLIGALSSLRAVLDQHGQTTA